MADEPDQIRQENQERTKGAEPDPGVRKKAPLRREEQRNENRESKEGRRVFVFHSESDEEPEPQPVTGLALIDRADNAPGARDPNERLECVHREPMMKDQVNGRGEDRGRSQALGENAAAHFACEFSGQPNRRATSKRGEQAQTIKRFTESVPCKPGDEGDERRLIDVAGAEMLGAGEIIQFVAKDSVTARGAEMEENFGSRQEDHNRRPARETIGACAIRARDVKCRLHRPMTRLTSDHSPLLRMEMTAGVFPGRYMEAP